MKNYLDIGLTPNLQSITSKATGPREWTTEYAQDAQFEKGPFLFTGNMRQDGTATFAGDLTQTGDVTQTGDFTLTGSLTVGGTAITGAYSKGEIGYGINQTERQWTNSSTYNDVNASKFKLDGDSFALTNVYFEVLGCVELADRTGYYQLYNITDGVAVTNSEINTTNVGTQYAWVNAEVVRSGTLAIPSGVKEYKMQFKQTGGGTAAGDTVQLLKAQMIFVNT